MVDLFPDLNCLLIKIQSRSLVVDAIGATVGLELVWGDLDQSLGSIIEFWP